MTAAPEAQILAPEDAWMQFQFADTTAAVLRGKVVWVDWPKVVRGQCACGAKFPVIVETLPEPVRTVALRGKGPPFYVCKCFGGRLIE